VDKALEFLDRVTQHLQTPLNNEEAILCFIVGISAIVTFSILFDWIDGRDNENRVHRHRDDESKR
jgi:hypothetical protein